MESIIASPLCYPEEIAYNIYVSWLTANSVQGTCPESPKMYIIFRKIKAIPETERGTEEAQT